MKTSVSMVSVLVVLLSAANARADAELTGTYVRYLSVGDNGVMLTLSSRSMQYGESATGEVGCDLYGPRTGGSLFTVHATGPSGDLFVQQEPLTFSGGFSTVAGPTATGRAITWTGEHDPSDAADPTDQVRLRLTQRYAYELDARNVTVEVTLENVGTVSLTDVYFSHGGDPDHGRGATDCLFQTTDDVRAQPPADGYALLTSESEIEATGAPLTVGIGSLDPRARVSTPSFREEDLAADGLWNSPVDDDGETSDDGMIGIAFREPTLAAGASTTFVFQYVWGPTPTEVERRFLGASGCDGCQVGGTCYADGDPDPANPCGVCDPSRDASAFSQRPEGTACGEDRCADGAMERERACDADGVCVAAVVEPCPSGACASDAECDATAADAGPDAPDGGPVPTVDAGAPVGPATDAGVPPPPVRSSGGCCAVAPAGSRWGGPLTVATLALLVWRRRRRS